MSKILRIKIKNLLIINFIEVKTNDQQAYNLQDQAPQIEPKEAIPIGNTFKTTADKIYQNINMNNRVDPNLINNNNNTNTSNATNSNQTTTVQKKKFSLKSLLCQIL